jgi:hypothetical protein
MMGARRHRVGAPRGERRRSVRYIAASSASRAWSRRIALMAAGKPAYGRHLDENLAQLLDGEADVTSRVQVDVELGFAAALGGEHGHGGELAVPEGQPRAGVDVTEGILDDVAAEIAERVHDGFAGGAVDLGELVAAAGVAVMCRGGAAQGSAPVARSW